MTSEPPPRDALRPLRPLPSIDVPLLRSERSAARSRHVVILAIAGGLLLSGGALLALTLPSGADKPGLPAQGGSEGDVGSGEPFPAGAAGAAGTGDVSPARVAQLERAATEPALVQAAISRPGTSNTNFGKAASFRDALEKTGCSRDETNALIAAFNGIVDFRRAQPEHTLTLERNPAGELVRFEYRASLTQRYEATRGEAGQFEGRQIEVPVRTQRVARGGVVSGSLGDTFEGLKLGRSLVGIFTEVFAGRVNFSTDTRAGDEFRVIFDEEQVDGALLRYGTVHAIEYKGQKTGLLRAFWHVDAREQHETGADGDFYDEQGRAMHGGWLRTPLRYDHISSGFGMRFHPVLKRKKLHNGIDYAAATGTQVRAAAAGNVRFAGPNGPNGNLLVLTHPGGFESFYAHLSRFATGIRAGTKVKQRQLIAYVGSTGRSTGPHLHFSLKKNGAFIDPNSQLNGPGLPMAARELPEFKRQVRELTSALAKVKLEQPSPVSASGEEAPADLGEEEL
jgi:hypothetical protein